MTHRVWALEAGVVVGLGLSLAIWLAVRPEEAPLDPLELPLPSDVPDEPPTVVGGCKACHGFCEWAYVGHVRSCTAEECVCVFPDGSTARVVWSEGVSKGELESRARWERHSDQIGIRHHYEH